MPRSGPVIRVNNLVKKFGSVVALDGLNLEVAPGEIHGFLGPNGAGKSTTIRVLLGLLRKTSGEALLFGRPADGDPAELHSRLAYVPGEVNLWPNLSGGECIDLLAHLGGGLNKRKRSELLKHFDLDPRRKFRHLSRGNRQKVALIAALATDVDLYIFDEPTSGLDPLMELAFRECAKELGRDGKTVLLSSHLLSEVEALCERVTFIRRGRRIASGRLEDMQKLRRNRISLRTKRPAGRLGELKGVHNLEEHGPLKISFEADTGSLAAILSKAAEFGLERITSREARLEDFFRDYYEQRRSAKDSNGATD